MIRMGDLRWSRSRSSTITSSNRRFQIVRHATSRYTLLDRTTGSEVYCSRLKDAKALAERIRVDEVALR